MSNTFVLVHGAWHGGWAWKQVAEMLAENENLVITPDLPGHGDDRRALSEVTMEAYVNRISEVVAEQPGKVILVGHSMSGAVIGQVAERHPEKIRKLVYVCAFLLPNGKSVLQVMGEDQYAEFGGRLTFNEAGNGAKFDDATFRETFYNEASEFSIHWAKPQLLEYQATAPLGTPVVVTAERFGSIPRVYIKCLRDKVLSPWMQQQLIDHMPCEERFELNADHAPFASAPGELARTLITIGQCAA